MDIDQKCGWRDVVLGVARDIDDWTIDTFLQRVSVPQENSCERALSVLDTIGAMVMFDQLGGGEGQRRPMGQAIRSMLASECRRCVD